MTNNVTTNNFFAEMARSIAGTKATGARVTQKSLFLADILPELEATVVFEGGSLTFDVLALLERAQQLAVVAGKKPWLRADKSPKWSAERVIDAIVKVRDEEDNDVYHVRQYMSDPTDENPHGRFHIEVSPAV